MKTIAALSQKGGVTKTSTIVNMAAVAAGRKDRCWIIDMDKQASADRWGEVREKNAALPRVKVVMAHTALMLGRALLQARDDGANVVFIDTPQASDEEHFGAIASAHVVLIPCKPYFFDANSILRTIQRAEKEPREIYVLFADVEPGERGEGHIAGAKAAIRAAAPRVKFCEHAIHHNAEIPVATGKGMGVIESAPATKSAREFKALTDWALEEAARIEKIVAAGPDTSIKGIRERVADMTARGRKP